MKIFRASLLVLVILCCALPCPAEDSAAPADPSISPAASTDSNTVIKAYYFHGTRRCKTCNAIESTTLEALETGFGEMMKKGEITWETANYELDENTHFEKDYELIFSSVILAKYTDGKRVEWKNLQKVWELIRDKKAFTEYIQNEVRLYQAL